MVIYSAPLLQLEREYNPKPLINYYTNENLKEKEENGEKCLYFSSLLQYTMTMSILLLYASASTIQIPSTRNILFIPSVNVAIYVGAVLDLFLVGSTNSPTWEVG